jgi:hypothetical protein
MYDLKDTTFIVPFMKVSDNRQSNMSLTVDYLKKWFDTTIIIVEGNGRHASEIPETTHIEVDMPECWSMGAAINAGVHASKTPYIFHNEIDTITYPEHYVKAVEYLRNEGDYCYPYDGRLLSVHREACEDIETSLDLRVIDESKLDVMQPWCVGGAVAYKRDLFIKNGMCNEYIMDWGPTDKEQEKRMGKLGARIYRIKSNPLFHLCHHDRLCHKDDNPYIDSNNEEYYKVVAMTKEELIEYVDTWPWIK